MRCRIGLWILTWAACSVVVSSRAADVTVHVTADVTVDCSEVAGEFRPLHGVNGGPLDRGGLVDLSAHFRELAVPLARLHDCHWPNPDVVDMHVVFPDPAADPEQPASYDFVRTDEYLRAVNASGSKIVYRLGESIEHGPDKRRQRPPAHYDRWAAACVGIVRHYNEGWANGFRHDIRYWEIWNEPDNRPNCWTGGDEDYFRLYATAARAIRKRFPDLRVGGPAVGNVGRIEWHRDGVDLLKMGPEPLLVPAPFVERFLETCRRDALPLDFFSWHTYGNDPKLITAQAVGVRKLLDRYGFNRTESHLNEWNYLPDNDWEPVMLKGQGEKRRTFYDRMGGAEGAAFVAETLLALQDCPVDAANFFNGDTGEFGLFDRYGAPRKTFYAFKAFRLLLDTPVRVRADVKGTSGPEPSLAAAAGTTPARDAVQVMIARRAAGECSVTLAVKGLPWPGATRYEVFVLDDAKNLEPATSGTLPAGPARLEVVLKGPAVGRVRFTQAGPTP